MLHLKIKQLSFLALSKCWHFWAKMHIFAFFYLIQYWRMDNIYSWLLSLSQLSLIMTKFEFWWIPAQIHHESNRIFITLTPCYKIYSCYLSTFSLKRYTWASLKDDNSVSVKSRFQKSDFENEYQVVISSNQWLFDILS